MSAVFDASSLVLGLVLGTIVGAAASSYLHSLHSAAQKIPRKRFKTDSEE